MPPLVCDEARRAITLYHYFDESRLFRDSPSIIRNIWVGRVNQRRDLLCCSQRHSSRQYVKLCRPPAAVPAMSVRVPLIISRLTGARCYQKNISKLLSTIRERIETTKLSLKTPTTAQKMISSANIHESSDRMRQHEISCNPNQYYQEHFVVFNHIIAKA